MIIICKIRNYYVVFLYFYGYIQKYKIFTNIFLLKIYPVTSSEGSTSKIEIGDTECPISNLRLFKYSI